MKLTQKEIDALRAIAMAAEAATGDRSQSWWSNDILDYADDYTDSPITFAAVCGSLVKKGLVFSQEYERNQNIIRVSPEGLKCLDEQT